MTASIITIGDEILIGQTLDTNSAYIAKSLDNIGIRTTEIVSISDDADHIMQTLAAFQDSVDIVIMTGGLGPTKDDITKKTLCEYFDDHLIVDRQTLEHVTELTEAFFKRPITQINKDQALVPSKALVLTNRFGTAPGMWMKKGNTVYISLPGVPYEMKGLMESEVIPKITAEFKRPFVIHKNILTYGIGESLLAERIAVWEDSLPPSIRLAYLPSPGKVKLRITARGTDHESIVKDVDSSVGALEKIIGDVIVGYDEEETIETVIARLLSESRSTISTAESFTGGRIASILTANTGSSAYFRGSAVCYATDTKTSVLGVPASIIEKHSVVSAEVAAAMSENARKIFNTDYAIATTGNAGPSKGDSDAEIGTVFISVATPNDVVTQRFDFGQPREKVIARSTNKALEMLRVEILKIVR